MCAGDDEHAQCVHVRCNRKRARLGKSGGCPLFHCAAFLANRSVSLRRRFLRPGEVSPWYDFAVHRNDGKHVWQARMYEARGEVYGAGDRCNLGMRRGGPEETFVGNGSMRVGN